MEQIDRLPAGGAQKTRSLPVAAVIALASVLVLIGVIAVVGYWMYGASSAERGGVAKEDLSSVVFTRTVAEERFVAPSGNWQPIGDLPVGTSADGGLRPGAASSATGEAYVGGGIVFPAPVSAAGEPVAVDVEIDGRAGEGLIPQVFVTDQFQFSKVRGTGTHELVWAEQDGQAQVVLPDGRVAAGRELPAGDPHAATTVRIVVGRDAAIVQTDGAPLWAGPHGLAADRPRYVGVRFLAKAGAKGDAVIKSVRVQKAGEAR
jgi:hypothetical protein